MLEAARTHDMTFVPKRACSWEAPANAVPEVLADNGVVRPVMRFWPARRVHRTGTQAELEGRRLTSEAIESKLGRREDCKARHLEPFPVLKNKEGRPNGRPLCFEAQDVVLQPSLRAEVREVERNFLHFGLEKRDGLLKGVALGARDAHDVALDGGRELEGLGVLDDALNGLPSSSS